MTTLEEAFLQVEEAMQQLIDTIIEAISPIIEAIKEAFVNAWETLKSFIAGPQVVIETAEAANTIDDSDFWQIPEENIFIKERLYL